MSGYIQCTTSLISQGLPEPLWLWFWGFSFKLWQINNSESQNGFAEKYHRNSVVKIHNWHQFHQNQTKMECVIMKALPADLKK